MVNDDTWVEAQFTKNFDNVFHKFKNNRIAIYGIGKNAQRILNYCKGYTFSCVCANDHLGEVFCGYVIVPLNEALKNSDLMIIAATAHSTEIIYNRIKPSLSKNYFVYNMLGHNLSLVCDYNENDYWKKNFNNLIHAIDTHEIISFDIFDTLLMRKTLYPEDVFSLVEELNNDEGDHKPFAKWRVDAERRQLEQGHLPNWQEIYQFMKNEHHLSDANVQKWKNREWEIELRALIPRKDMVKALEYAKQHEKKVVLCSDMYFDQCDMQKLLFRSGISGYDALFISCDYQATKSDGKLFIPILKYSANRSILHIGDNELSDYIMPKQLGVDTYLIKNSLDMLKISSCAAILKHTFNLFDRLLLGDIISYLFNSPFSLSGSRGKVVLYDLYSYVCLCILPVTMRYMQYILQLSRNERGAIMLFVSRDGYFLQKIYKKISSVCNLPDSVYFYTSRQVAYASMISNENEFQFMVQYILKMVNENLKYQLEHIFHIHFSQKFDMTVEEAKKYYGIEKLKQMIYSYEDDIFKREKQNRKKYLEYLNKLNLEKYNKIFCIDLGTKGTIVYALRSLLHRPVELIALSGGDGIADFVPEETYRHVLYGEYNPFSPIWSYAQMLEMVYASKDGQVSNFDNNGDPIFAADSKYDADLLDEVQKILMDKIEKCIDKNWFKHTLSNEFCSEMLGLMSKEFTDISANVSKRFAFTDSLNHDLEHVNNFLHYLRNENG